MCDPFYVQVSDFGLHELREAAECESGCEGLQSYKLLWKAPEHLRQGARQGLRACGWAYMLTLTVCLLPFF